MNELTKLFAQAIVRDCEVQSSYEGYYCNHCGKRSKDVLCKNTGFFVSEPAHMQNCVVLKAEEYLKEQNVWN